MLGLFGGEKKVEGKQKSDRVLYTLSLSLVAGTGFEPATSGL